MSSAEIDALWTIDDPSSGLKKLKEALIDFPGSSDEIHTQICRSLGLQRKFQDGWDELAKVSATTTAIVKVRVQLESGRLKNTAGDQASAKPYFESALRLAEKGHFDYYAVDAAHMLAIVTKSDESIKWNEAALKMAAKSHDARTKRWRGSLLNNLAWAYHDMGDYSKALGKFQEAEAFQKRNGDPVSYRISKWAVARCFRSMKRYQDAVAILEELVKYPEQGYVSEELGEDLLALGRPEDAKPHFKTAYELLSGDPYMREHESARLNRLNKLGE